MSFLFVVFFTFTRKSYAEMLVDHRALQVTCYSTPYPYRPRRPSCCSSSPCTLVSFYTVHQYILIWGSCIQSQQILECASFLRVVRHPFFFASFFLALWLVIRNVNSGSDQSTLMPLQPLSFVATSVALLSPAIRQKGGVV